MAAHRQRDQQVAGVAHQAAHAVAFAAEHKAQVDVQVDAVQRLDVRADVQPDDPHVVVLQFLEGGDQIADLGDLQVLHRAGGGGYHRLGDAHAAPLLEDDAVNADRVSDAQQAADVLRVLQQVERQEEVALVAQHGRFQQRLEVGVDIGAGPQHHALVVGPFGQIVDDAARHAADAHPARLRCADDVQDWPLFLHRLQQQKLLEVAAVGPQRFQHRPAAVEKLRHARSTSCPRLRPPSNNPGQGARSRPRQRS